MESSNDPRLLIGVGEGRVVTKLTVRWPSGGRQYPRSISMSTRPTRSMEPAGSAGTGPESNRRIDSCA